MHPADAYLPEESGETFMIGTLVNVAAVGLGGCLGVALALLL